MNAPCTSCKKHPREGTYTKCSACRAYDRRWDRKDYAKKRAARGVSPLQKSREGRDILRHANEISGYRDL